MTKLCAICLLTFGMVAKCQTTVIIPAPDGVTISESPAGLLSCIAAPLPAGLEFDGTMLKVAKISTTQLLLTGGTVYPAGEYVVKIDATGNVTYKPYVAPTSKTLYIPITITSSASPVPIGNYRTQAFTIPAGTQIQRIVVTPSGASTPPNAIVPVWVFGYFVTVAPTATTAGKGFVFGQNVTTSPLSFPSTPVIVAVN